MRVQLDPDTMREIVHLVCPHCAASVPVRQRGDTGEWVHDLQRSSSHVHCLCWASRLRRSRFGELLR